MEHVSQATHDVVVGPQNNEDHVDSAGHEAGDEDARYRDHHNHDSLISRGLLPSTACTALAGSYRLTPLGLPDQAVDEDHRENHHKDERTDLGADTDSKSDTLNLVSSFGVDDGQEGFVAVSQEGRANLHSVVDGDHADDHDAEDGCDDDDGPLGRDDALHLQRQCDAHAALECDESRDQTAGPCA